MVNLDQINREIIEQLVESGVDINSIGTYNGNDSYTFLHAAIDNGDIESVQFILSKNPNVNALVKNYGPIDDDGDSDDSDDEDESNYGDKLKSECSKVEDKGKSFRDYSPLHIAVNKNRLDIVKLLLAYGADINIEIENCHSVLNTAIKTDNIELIELLLESGADVNYVSCFKQEFKELIEYFHDNSIPAKLNCFAPLHVAIKRGNFEIVKLLIYKGANLNIEAKNDKSALVMAVDGGNYQMVEYLLDHGANVNCEWEFFEDKEYPALNLAVKSNRFDIVKLLVSYGAKTDDNGLAIFLAIKRQNFKMVKLLIKLGFDVNVSDNNGDSETVPFDAAYNGSHFDIIELLLINGADLNPPITYDVYNFEFSVSDDRKKNQIITEHIIKVRVLEDHAGYLENVDLSSSEVKIPDDRWDEEESELQIEAYTFECQEEIDKMKTETIGTSCLSYYELLEKNIYQLAMYAKNLSIAEVLSSEQVEENFPIYGAIIKNCFEKGVFRKELLEQVEKQLSDILSKLPYSVVMEVFSYLKNEDIKHFVKYLNI